MRYLLLLMFAVFAHPAFAQHEKHDIPPTSSFEVTGAVNHPLKVRVADLAGFREDSLGDIVLRNKKDEQKGVAKGAKGVLLKAIIDSAGIDVDKPKEYSEINIVLTASDGYKNVYSWSELFNTEVGNHVYVVTALDGKAAGDMPDRILVISLADFNSGSRHLKGLASVQVEKIK